MKKKNAARCVIAACTVILLCAIYIMSAEPAKRSSEMSLSVGRTIGKIINPDFDIMTASEQTEYARSIDRPVRKTAHFVEFFALGALLCAGIALWDVRGARLILTAAADGVIFAVLDELHQLTVPGRAGMTSDVLLDTAGVLCGAAAVFAAVCASDAAKKKRSGQNARGSL